MILTKRLAIRMLLLIFCYALLGIAQAQAQAEGQRYTVVRTFMLHRKVNGIAGTLELLMDKRLTQLVRVKLWGNGDWSFVFPKDSTQYKEFSSHPPGNAELRIIDSAGNVVAKHDLERPLAKLEAWSTASKTDRFYLLAQDYSTGAGSYNGLVTTVLEVSDGVLRDAKALDMDSHNEEPFKLMKSLKSDWKIASSQNGDEILSVSCHPNKSGHFVIDYIRYSLVGAQWREYKREVHGYWESDNSFPKKSAFPY